MKKFVLNPTLKSNQIKLNFLLDIWIRITETLKLDIKQNCMRKYWENGMTFQDCSYGEISKLVCTNNITVVALIATLRLSLHFC